MVNARINRLRVIRASSPKVDEKRAAKGVSSRLMRFNSDRIAACSSGGAGVWDDGCMREANAQMRCV